MIDILGSYSDRLVKTIVNLLSDEAELKADHIVSNRMMGAREVDYDRGYIAGLKRGVVIATVEAPNLLNKEEKNGQSQHS